jgi:hypothetical protein
MDNIAPSYLLFSFCVGSMLLFFLIFCVVVLFFVMLFSKYMHNTSEISSFDQILTESYNFLKFAIFRGKELKLV